MREDILEGLRLAVSKGETLQQAMQSFYNAGYKKEEIEEAARNLQMQQAGRPIETIKKISSQKTEISEKEKISPQIESKQVKQGFFGKITESLMSSGKSKNKEQSTSIYDQNQEEKEKPQKLAIILLAVVLIVLFLGLIGVLLFRDQIANLFR